MHLGPARRIVALWIAGACLSLGACASGPLAPYSTETPPLMLVPAAQAGVADGRGRFREIYCAVLEAHGHELPDYRPCDEALTRVGDEPAAKGRAVDLGPSSRHLVALLVPGIGWDCVEDWLEAPGSAANHVAHFGYELSQIHVDALSGTPHNARQIRDALLAMPEPEGAPRLVLVGYSKGTPDILEAVVSYPEIRSRIAAVVSIAGAVGGSPIADDSKQSDRRPDAALPGLDVHAGRRGRRREPWHGDAARMARRESAAGRPAVLLTGDVSAAGSHFQGPQVELSQAGGDRRPERRAAALLRPADSRQPAHGLPEFGPLGGRPADCPLA